jgi:transcriptional regulator with XRE-family HTH domain
MNLKKIGETIKKRRELLSLRQEDLAELCDVSIKSIHVIEQGTGNPAFETLRKVVDLLGLELTLQIKRVS